MLKPKELQILNLLAQGLNYDEIADKFQVHRSVVHAHCHQIRVKTGIRSTKSAPQCQTWLDQNPNPAAAKPAPSVKPPTPKQLEAMELYAVQKFLLQKIAYVMGISKQNAELHLDMGISRARIKPRGFNHDSRADIVEYLNSLPKDPMSDPAF